MKKLSVFFAAAAISVLLTSCGRTEIKLSDYVETKSNGYNGQGVVEVDLDIAKFVQQNYEAFGLKNGYSAIQCQAVVDDIREKLKGNFDKDKDLSNGDSVRFSWDTATVKSLEQTYKVRFVTDDVEYTVSDLQDVIEVNPFDNLEVTFDGTAPNGYLKVEYPRSDGNSFHPDLSYSKANGLANGDTVTISLKQDADYYLSRGYLVTETEREYTVSGLDSYLTELDALPQDASEKMDSNGKDLLQAEIATYWDDPAALDGIECIGNYLLTAKTSAYPENILIYVYEIKTNGFSYYSYVQYREIMLLGDGTCSFNLNDTVRPVGLITGYAENIGITFQHDGLSYIGYEELDSLFNDAVTKQISQYNYESTVS